jgi:outer membrane protein OmpA-like peptidoglycan-associated protein
MAVLNSRTFALPFALAAALLLAPSVGAQVRGQGPAYTANDIVERFAPMALGSTRGLCIGTEDECSAKPAAVGAASAASPVPVFDLVVTFDHNSDALTGPAKQNLSEFARALNNQRLRDLSFLVEGHTDAKGSETYNFDLSQRRAQAVVRYLTAQGVDGARVVAKGYGETKPRASDPFDPANRRVETRVNTVTTTELR